MYTTQITHTHTQEQYVEEGVEWDVVPVELNQALINTFNKVT